MKKKLVAMVLSAVLFTMSGTPAALAAESPAAEPQIASTSVQTVEADAEEIATADVDTEEAAVGESEEAAVALDGEDVVVESVDPAELADVFTEEAAESDVAVDADAQEAETEEMVSVEDAETMPQYEASFASATTVKANTTYTDSISESDTSAAYKITLPTSGELTVDVTAYMNKVNIYLYEENGTEQYSTTASWNSVTEQSDTEFTKDLTSGVYYLVVSEYYSYGTYYTGDYKFSFSFESAKETFKEVSGGNDNTLEKANNITLGTEYRGQIAENDTIDYYKFTVGTTGEITLNATAKLNKINYYFYDEEGTQVYGETVSWDSVAGQSVFEESVELEKGTYYFVVSRYYSYGTYYTGNYKFTLGSDSYVGPVANAVIGGRAADALRINWSANTAADGYILEQYKSGSWTRIAKITDSSTETYRVSGLSAGTTYKFRIRCYSYSGSTPIYSEYVYVSGKTNPATVSGLSISGKTSSSLTLSWTKDSKASGYIVQQYKNGSWTRIAKVGSNSTVSHTVSGLSAGTTYKFRVCSYAFDGSTAIYGAYKTVSGTTSSSSSSSSTSVSAMTGVKIGGRAADALRVSWTKNSSAAGYIVEQYKSGSWTRVAKITSNSTTSYRVSGLSAYTTYKFRVKAYAYSGSTAIYSAYKTISGKTLPTAVSSFKVSSKSSSSLTLSWTKNSNCDGYIIDVLQDDSWVRVAKVTSNSTTSYRVGSLSSGSTYVYRIYSYGFDGSTAIYSAVSTTYGTTN